MHYFMPCFLKIPLLAHERYLQSDLKHTLLRFLVNPNRFVCDGKSEICFANTTGRQLKQRFSFEQRQAVVSFLRQYGTSFPVDFEFRYHPGLKQSVEQQKIVHHEGAKRHQREQNDLIIAAMDYWMTPPKEPFKSTKAGKHKKRA